MSNRPQVILDGRPLTLTPHAAAIVAWVTEHQADLPESGCVRFDCGSSSVKAKIERAFPAMSVG